MISTKDTQYDGEVNMEDEDLSPIAPLMSKVLAENLKRYMEINDISGNGLAMRSGVSQKTLWVTINQKNIPTVDTAAKICKALNVDMRVMVSRHLTDRELNRTGAIGRAMDALIALPTEKVSAVREVMDAFAK